MSTLQEIRRAIEALNCEEKALLVAELFATDENEDTELEAALDRGLADVEAGRVRSIEEVQNMIPSWTSKS